MAAPRSVLRALRVTALVALLLPLVSAQSQIVGRIPAALDHDVDVVAEARLALAWFPVELGRGSVDADGAFVLRFHHPLPLAREIGMSAQRLFADLRCDDLQLSDPDARVVLVRDLRVIPDGAPCEYCETLAWLSFGTRPRDAFAASGDLELQWIHSDRALRVSGLCHYGWGTETYALELHAGWNTLLLETVVVHPSEGYCDCRDVVVREVSGYPQGLAWHLRPQR